MCTQVKKKIMNNIRNQIYFPKVKISTWRKTVYVPASWELPTGIEMSNMWAFFDEPTTFRDVSLSIATATAKSLQSCPTLCDPVDGSPPGSAVPGNDCYQYIFLGRKNWLQNYKVPQSRVLAVRNVDLLFAFSWTQVEAVLGKQSYDFMLLFF